MSAQIERAILYSSITDINIFLLNIVWIKQSGDYTEFLSIANVTMRVHIIELAKM